MNRLLCLLIIAILSTPVVSGEPFNQTYDGNKIVTATISGSPETPDPVLNRVRQLEKQGVLSHVVVKESYPVQISFTGPLSALNELRKIPRKRLK